jgi:hypothetical protein
MGFVERTRWAYGQAFERFQRFLERRHPEHAVRAGAGDRDPDIGAIWFASPNVNEEKRDEGAANKIRS